MIAQYEHFLVIKQDVIVKINFEKILNNKIKNNINSTLKECSKNILSYTKLSKDKIQNYTELNEWIGLYNIDKIYNKKVTNSYGKKVPVNDLLDSSIKDMKIKLNEFYESNIEKKMFKYELLKWQWLQELEKNTINRHLELWR